MDPEMKAMTAVIEAFKDLEPETLRRVLSWANQRYQPSAGTHHVPSGMSTPADPVAEVVANYREFHELFDAANPGTSVEKVLVVGYWFQIVERNEDLDSAELNRALKNLGHPSSNITRDLDALIRRSPRLVMQVSKGPSVAGRKRYKLTREGVRAVERLVLASQGNGNGGC